MHGHKIRQYKSKYRGVVVTLNEDTFDVTEDWYWVNQFHRYKHESLRNAIEYFKIATGIVDDDDLPSYGFI